MEIPKDITPEQALNILAQSTEKFIGTKQDHFMIALALKTLEKRIRQPIDGTGPAHPSQGSKGSLGTSGYSGYSGLGVGNLPL